MIELLGKIVTLVCHDEVFIFRLTQDHIDLGVLDDVGCIINESTSIEKRIWFEAFEIMQATNKADMGLVLNHKQYNKILKGWKDFQVTVQPE